MNMYDYLLLDITREGQVATITLKRLERHLREKAETGRPGGAQRADEVARANCAMTNPCA